MSAVLVRKIGPIESYGIEPSRCRRRWTYGLRQVEVIEEKCSFETLGDVDKVGSERFTESSRGKKGSKFAEVKTLSETNTMQCCYCLRKYCISRKIGVSWLYCLNDTSRVPALKNTRESQIVR